MKAREYRAIAQALYELRVPHGTLIDEDADKVALGLADLFALRFGFYQRYSKDRFLSQCGVSWQKRRDARDALERKAREALEATTTSNPTTPIIIDLSAPVATPQPAEVSDWIKKAFEANP